MPNLLDILVGKLALKRELVRVDALQECAAEQRANPGLSLGQLLVRRRLLAPQQLVELVHAAEAVQLACPGCGQRYTHGALRGGQDLACPRCRSTLRLIHEGTEISDRLATGQSIRYARPREATRPDPGTPGPTPGPSPGVTQGQSSRRFVPPSVRGDFAGHFGPYEILEELGRGGMGVVYKARQPALDRFVALKILLAGELASRTQVKRFQQEAEIASRLKHPAIVQIHDVGKVGEHYYFTMDFVAGEPLSKVIKRRKLGVRRSVEIAAEVARGLHHAHQAGAIHRDIKPANIIIGGDGRPVITDFGLARELDLEQAEKLTRSGAMVGTPYYMSPEQVRGERSQVGAATDIYALGVVLFEMLTFDLPFRGKTQMELTTKILKEEAPRPTSIEPAVARDVETIVLKAMAKQTADRYATAGELAEDLERYLAGQPIKARRLGAGVRLARQARDHRWALAGALVGVVVVAGATFALVRQAQGPRVVEAPEPEPEPEPPPEEHAPPPEEPALDPRAEEALAEAHQALDRAERTPAGASYRLALEEAARAFARARGLGLDDPAERVREGAVLERLGRAEEADEAYAAVLALGPQAEPFAEALFRRCRLLIRRTGEIGEPTAALELLAEHTDALETCRAGPWKELVRAVLALHRDGEPQRALEHVHEAQELDRTLPEAYSVEGAVRLELKQYDGARGAFDRVLEIDSKSAVARAQLGRLLALEDQYERAMDELRRALEIDPDQVLALQIRAMLHQARMELSEAARDLRRVHEQRPHDVTVTLSLAQLYDLDGRTHQADQLLAQVMEEAPDDPRPYELLATRALERNDFARAMAELRRGLEALAPYPEPRAELAERFEKLAVDTNELDTLREYAAERLDADPDDSEARALQAKLLMVEDPARGVERGLALLDELLEEDPSCVKAWRFKLLALMEPGREDALQRALSECRAAVGDDVEGRILVTRILILTGRLQAGQELLAQVARQQPDDPQVKLLEAFLLLQRERVDDAKALLEEAAELDPTSAEIFSLLGVAEMNASGDPQVAFAALSRAYSLDPFNPEVLHNMALLLSNVGRPQRCLTFCRGVVRRFEAARRPPPPGVVAALGSALVDLREPQQAIALLEDAAQRSADLDVRVVLARAYATVGRRDDALRLLDEVLQVDPRNPGARALRQQLGG